MDQEIIFRSDMTVNYIQHMGSDAMIAAAAKVSVSPEESMELTKSETAEGISGLIGYLARMRHTTPFEHNTLTIYTEVPLFVAREWMRHRTQSLNEWSARYSFMEPVFHIPGPERPMIPVEGFKPARPHFERANSPLYEVMDYYFKNNSINTWKNYLELVEFQGIAREVARGVLPVNIYTKFWATANLLNWFRFISLRTHNSEATYVSYPQYEIDEAAQKVESIIENLWPIAYEKFVKYGRVL